MTDDLVARFELRPARWVGWQLTGEASKGDLVWGGDEWSAWSLTYAGICRKLWDLQRRAVHLAADSDHITTVVLDYGVKR